MEISENSERPTKEGDYMPIVLFTAGTAFLVAAFVKRTVMLLLMERWRVWVFMAINLVLLAIFFTSNPSPPIQNRARDSHSHDKAKKRDKNSGGFPSKGSEEDDSKKSCSVEVDGEEEKMEVPRLSKEELNERVEAFIVMFKQHLVSDARRSATWKHRHSHWNAQNKAAQSLNFPKH